MMNYRKIALRCIFVLIFMFGYNLHAAMGQNRIERNSPEAQRSQDTTRQVESSSKAPKRSVGNSSRVSPAVQSKPLLTIVENRGCVYPGTILKLKGRDLGQPGSYNLYLKTSAKQVDLTAAAKRGQWTTNQIQLQLPQSIASGLAGKEAVRIGFQQQRGQWLTSVKFDLCSQTEKIVKPSHTRPQLLKVENTGCVSAGDIVRLKGRNFGRPGSYRLYLQTHGKNIDLTPVAQRKKWSADRIELQLPLTVAYNLPEGGTARIGFLSKEGSWLDSVKLNLCKKIDAGPDDLTVKEGPFTGLPDLMIKGIGVEEIGNLAIDLTPNRDISQTQHFSTPPAINYVFTVGNIGSKSADKNSVFIECFGPNGGECPYGLQYKDGIERPVDPIPVPQPDFRISHSGQKISVGPFPLIGRALAVTWRITVDAKDEVVELREDNNVKTFSYQEPQTDLFSILTLSDFQPSSGTVSVAPVFQLFNGLYEDDNQESYTPIVKAGPHRVLFECFSKSGFKCPPNYPVSVEVDYMPEKSCFLCKDWEDCQEPQVIGHSNVSKQDLLATKTEWHFKTTVDADNVYPEMNENNNFEYASISWAENSVKVTDEKTKSLLGVAQTSEPQAKKNLPIIDYFLVLHSKSPVSFPLGTLNPGSTVLLGGKRFPENPDASLEVQVDKTSIKPLKPLKLHKKTPSNKIFLFGDFGVRELQDVKWISEEKAQGVVPNDITWPTEHTAYLRIARKDGEQSPPKDIGFFPALDIRKLDLESGKQVIKVVRCDTDSNLDTCNGKVYHSQDMPNTIFHEMAGEKASGVWTYNNDYAMQGSHANVWGAVGNDVGYDIFKIELKNGWIISKVDWKVQRFDAEAETQITSHTQPDDAIGKSEWTARVDWQVDEGAEMIWYGYLIEIAGPVGTSPF